MRSHIAAALAVAGLLAAAPSGARPKKKAPAPAAECEADDDCVLVPDGCCGCDAGGKQRAIPAAAKASYDKKLRAMCKETMCPALMSEHETCDKRAVCKEGTCALGS